MSGDGANDDGDDRRRLIPTGSANEASDMEVELVDSVESIDAEKTTIDASDDFTQLLKLTTNATIREATNRFRAKPDQTIREIEAKMNRLSRYLENARDARPDDDAVLAQAYLQMSVIYHNPNFKKEKLYIADAYLTRCVKLLKDKELNRKAVAIVVSAYLELGHIWSKLENTAKSKRYFYEILQLYSSYTQERDDYPVPICILRVIGIEEVQNFINLDKLYWQALRNLIMMFDKGTTTKVEDESLLTRMHQLLKSHLRRSPLSIGRLEWVEHTMELTKLLLMQNRFVEAKNHATAATFMVKQFYNEEYAKVDAKRFPGKKDTSYEQYLDGISRVNMCWAWYGVTLLAASTERRQDVVVEEEEEEEEVEKKDSRSKSTIESTTELLTFADLGRDPHEFVVVDRDTYVVNYSDAMAVFQNVINCLNEVKISIERKSDLKLYVEFIRCTSRVYKYLAPFEQDKFERIELYKTRVTVLHSIMGSLCSTRDRYLYGYLSLEIAIATSNLLDVRLENFPIDEEPMSSLEIRNMVDSSVQSFQQYMNRVSSSLAEANV